VIKNVFKIFLISALVACAPKSENKQFTDLRKKQYEYQPSNEDRNILRSTEGGFDFEKVLGLDRTQGTKQPWIGNSLEIFKFAEHAMEIGVLSSQSDLNQFAHNLLSSFYSRKENSTQFGKENTMYLPAALWFEGEKIKSLFTKIATTQNIEGVEKSFQSNHQIQWPPQRPTLEPVQFIKSIRSYLDKMPQIFSQNGVGADFIGIFKAQVNKDYIELLNQAEVDLKDIDQNQNLKINSNTISTVIKNLTFIPQDVIQPLLENLEKAKNYADWIEKDFPQGGAHEGRLVKVIASIWLDLTPQQRDLYIKPANEMLYTRLNDTSEKMLRWLAGRGSLKITDREYFYSGFFKDGFIDRLGKSCHPEVYTHLSAWANYDDTQKAQLRASKPELFNVFSRYSTQEIRTGILNNYSENAFQIPFTNDNAVKRFSADIFPVCLSRTQALLDRSINLYLLAELDYQIRTWGSMIEKIVAVKTLENLRDIALAVQSQEKFKSFFHKTAYPIMDTMLFKGDTLNAIENSQVSLFINDENQLLTARSNRAQFQTGAEVLGTGLAVQYKRILGLPEYEKISPLSQDYYRVVFSQLNKMLVMMGFQTIDDKIVPSLHRKFYGDYDEFNVFKYDCSPLKVAEQQAKKERYAEAIAAGKAPEADDVVTKRDDCSTAENFYKSIFEIPDELNMTGAFTPGSYKKVSSVRAQAEVIRGSAQMLKYLSDWRAPNDFDKGMGKEKFSEIDIFPKHALVNLAVGLVTAPIRGLQHEGTPLRLFNLAGTEIKDWVKDGLPDPNDPSRSTDPSRQVIQAAITDLLPNGKSDTVKALDMAYFIVAIDEFLEATNGIENTKASVINPREKKVKENLESTIKGRRLLRLMMFAMSNFLLSRMQDQDGGFWSEYSLVSNEVSKNKPRELEVQLAVIRALLRVYEQWESEGALVSAVESYYFMNQSLWNEGSAFYKVTENSKAMEIKPYLYAQAVANFKSIEQYLNNSESQEQARRLFDMHSKEFLTWYRSTKVE
jgi:hypothetical protein